MTRKFSIFTRLLPTALLAILSLGGCKRDAEDCNCENPLLALNLTFGVGSYKSSIVTTYASAPTATQYDLRFVIDIYPDNIANPQLSDRLDHIVRLANDFNTGNNSVQILLTEPTQKVKILVWSDFIPKGTISDLFYDTSDLLAVKMITPATVPTTAKAAFEASTVIDPSTLSGNFNILDVPMEMPVANYQIVTNDVATYSSQTGVVPIAQLHSSVAYQMWLPTSYNVLTHSANNFTASVTYTFPVEDITASSAVVASDFVFVTKVATPGPNGHDSSVNLNMNILTPAQATVSIVNGITIPLDRGSQTTLNGQFITSAAQPAIGIDPTFGGELVITYQN